MLNSDHLLIDYGHVTSNRKSSIADILLHTQECNSICSIIALFMFSINSICQNVKQLLLIVFEKQKPIM